MFVTDPLYQEQWHLHGPYGLNVESLWQDYTGQGVSVVVFDSGVDPGHPDLDANYDHDHAFDAQTGLVGDLKGSPKYPKEFHGTAVAGIIAAERNGLGVVGITSNLANYVGSMAADRNGSLIGVSAPRAGAVAIVAAADARILGTLPLADGCGLAAAAETGRFVASSGSGVLASLGVDGGALTRDLLRTTAARWDNHLRWLAG